MSRINYFSIIGEVTFPTEIQESKNGDHFGGLGIKTSRVRKVRGETKAYNDYFNIRVWRELADDASSLERGQFVHVQGHIETYKSARTGTYLVSLVAESIVLVDNQTVMESEEIDPAVPANETGYGVSASASDSTDFADDLTDEDLPF